MQDPSDDGCNAVQPNGESDDIRSDHHHDIDQSANAAQQPILRRTSFPLVLGK